MVSEERRSKRRLLTLQRKGKLAKSEVEASYADNSGVEYSNKLLAMVSSFLNILFGCFLRGFPIVVSWLPYNAWAFYPFFFVRKKLNMSSNEIIETLNHERIHVVQQRDVHLVISLPLMVFFVIAEIKGWFNPLPFILVVPFMPTILYGIDLVRCCIKFRGHGKLSFNDVRKNTCFEKEAMLNSSNVEYLFGRKFWAVLEYMQWKS